MKETKFERNNLFNIVSLEGYKIPTISKLNPSWYGVSNPVWYFGDARISALHIKDKEYNISVSSPITDVNDSESEKSRLDRLLNNFINNELEVQ